MSFRHRHLSLYVWLLWLAIVILGSLLPAHTRVMRDIERLHVNDKIQHFAAYFVLGLLPLFSFQCRKWAIVLSLLTIALGGMLEQLQAFSPGRQPELADVVANTLGALCGLFLSLCSHHAVLQPASSLREP